MGMVTDNTIYLDTYQSKYITVTVTQYDINSRDLYIIPTSNGEEIDLTSCRADIAMKKPNDGIVIDKCDIEDNKKIHVVFTEEKCDVSGFAEANILISNSSGELVHTLDFKIKVVATALAELQGKVIESDSYKSFEKGLAELQELTKGLPKIKSDSETARAEAIKARDEAVAAAQLTSSVKGDADRAKNAAGAAAMSAQAAKQSEDNAAASASAAEEAEDTAKGYRDECENFYNKRTDILKAIPYENLPEKESIAEVGTTYIITNNFKVKEDDDRFTGECLGKEYKAGTCVYVNESLMYDCVALSFSGTDLYLSSENPAMTNCINEGTRSVALGGGVQVDGLEGVINDYKYMSTNGNEFKIDLKKYIYDIDPSMEYPKNIGISSTTFGTLKASMSYSNLIQYPYYTNGHKDYGVQWTVNDEDKSIKITVIEESGETTGPIDFSIKRIDNTYAKLVGGRTYTLSGTPETTIDTDSLKINIVIGNSADNKDEEGKNVSQQEAQFVNDNAKPKTFTVKGIEGKQYDFEIHIVSEGRVKIDKTNGFTFKPMLEEGAIAHEYIIPSSDSESSKDYEISMLDETYVAEKKIDNNGNILITTKDEYAGLFNPATPPTINFNYLGKLNVGTKVTGQDNIAIGTGAVAEGTGSYAMGLYSSADNGGIALGEGAISRHNGSIALGKFNEHDNENLLNIGNGESKTNRSNALELDQAGNMMIAGNLSTAAGSVADLFNFKKIFEIVTLTYDAVEWTTPKLFNKLFPKDFDSKIKNKGLYPIAINRFSSGSNEAYMYYAIPTTGEVAIKTLTTHTTKKTTTPQLRLLCINGNIINNIPSL